MNDVKFFDKMARKYIKRLKLKNDPEQEFYDQLADFINSWRGKHNKCNLIIKNIKKYNICCGDCYKCEYSSLELNNPNENKKKV